MLWWTDIYRWYLGLWEEWMFYKWYQLLYEYDIGWLDIDIESISVGILTIDHGK